MTNFEKKSTILTSKRESVSASANISAEGQKDALTSAAAAVKDTQRVFEEEDSLHGATTDLGGTTTPA